MRQRAGEAGNSLSGPLSFFDIYLEMSVDPGNAPDLFLGSRLTENAMFICRTVTVQTAR